MKKFLMLCIVCLMGHTLQAQPNQPTTRILFLFDASQSMYSQWQSGQRMDIAKKLIANLMDSISKVPNLQVGLRVFGHQSYVRSKTDRNCQDTKLEVPIGPNHTTKIKQRIKDIEPRGTTLIAYALEQAANDFTPCTNCRNIIVLITDGIEECDGDPCAISLAMQKNGVVLKPFVIGMDIAAELKDHFHCIGNYYDAVTEEAFGNILQVVISQVMNSTTVQVNLLDINGKPNETNVNMTFYDRFSGQIRHNYVHTMNHRGNPDTISIDPLGTYRLEVHTTPPVFKDSITFTPGIHNVVAVDAPQGILSLKIGGYNEYKQLRGLIRKKGEAHTLNVQEFNSTHKYIVGQYDLELLTLPRIILKDVKISQSHTTKIEVAQPGLVTVMMNSPGYASLYVEESNGMRWIYNLDENLTNQSLVIQPGKYRIVYRARNAREALYTVERQFSVESGSSVSVKFQ